MFVDDESIADDLVKEHRALAGRFQLSLLMILADSSVTARCSEPGVITAIDSCGRFRALYNAKDRSGYLVRPDGHLCACWRSLATGDLTYAVERAMAIRSTME